MEFAKAALVIRSEGCTAFLHLANSPLTISLEAVQTAPAVQISRRVDPIDASWLLTFVPIKITSAQIKVLFAISRGIILSQWFAALLAGLLLLG